MQNSLKKLGFGLLAAASLFAAAPALAQTYNQSYYYPQYTVPTAQYFVQPSYGSTCPNITYNLTLGSSDYYTQGQVSQLQSFLRSRYGDARLVGGYYGSLTTYYVQRFQQEQGVYPATGGVGTLTRQAILRTCGGSYPGYPTPTNPTNPSRPDVTFRLNTNFSLYEGQTGQLRNEELTIRLNDTDTRSDEVSITLGENCARGTNCFYYPTRTVTLEEGDSVEFQDYDIELVSLSSSGRATFHVEDADDNDDDNDDEGTIGLTAPDAGDEFEQGDEMDIEWDVNDEPSDASVVLELYDEDNDRVGTIAIVDADDGDYEWDIPEGGTVCTQQFPNGLCGYDLDGSFYIKAILKEDQGGSGSTLDTDESGEFEIED